MKLQDVSRVIALENTKVGSEKEISTMIRMEKSSKLTSSEAVDRAIAYFGPGGLDLEVTERAECCVRLEGGGGYVFVQAAEDKNAKGSLVEVESREWEYHVKRFLENV